MSKALVSTTMKAGAHMAYYAYQHLVRQGKTSKLPISFLYVPERKSAVRRRKR